MKTMRGVLPMLLAASLAAVTPVNAQEKTAQTGGSRVDPAEVAADALVVRPVSLAATVIGSAIFVVALPFAAIPGDVKGASDTLVMAPGRYTFKRRLGDFEAYK